MKYISILTILALIPLTGNIFPPFDENLYGKILEAAIVNTNQQNREQLATGIDQKKCVDGQQSGGVLYRICIPNNSLVIWAHTYVSPDEPLQIEDRISEDVSLSEIFNSLGYAFATPSYSKNGLVVKEGVDNLVELSHLFSTIHKKPEKTYLVGASQGGLITILAVESFPEIFDGGLAMCGLIGNFDKQINYIGDFRIVFDYFFPNIIPGSPIHIPQKVIDNWEAVYVPRVQNAIDANPSKTEQLIKVARLPTDLDGTTPVSQTVIDLLWFNILSTNDIIDELDGQPFDNSSRIYKGSDNDRRLNLYVKRFHADRTAINEINDHYSTSGILTSPIVTIHTTTDPIVPFWHEFIYRAKTAENSSGTLHTNIPIIRYGHCKFGS